MNDDILENIEEVEEVVEEVEEVVEETLISNNSVSQNIVEEVEEKESEENVKQELYSIVSSDNVSDNVYSDQVINRLDQIIEILNNQPEEASSDQVQIVSQDSIMTKHINDYTVQESLTLMVVVGLLAGVLVMIVRKGLFKWK